jgi:Domain of unknown function (DUF3480)
LGGFLGVAYALPDPQTPIRVPEDCLVGVLLKGGEVEMVEAFGARRVLAKLGNHYHYFPYPFWSDPDRPAVYSPGDASTSLLARLPWFASPDSSAALVGQEIRLTLSGRDAATMRESLEQGKIVTICPKRASGVRACLVWGPGQRGPIAIVDAAARETSIAVYFVTLIPTGRAEDHMRFPEDGVAAILSQASTRRIIKGLRKGEPVRIAFESAALPFSDVFSTPAAAAGQPRSLVIAFDPQSRAEIAAHVNSIPPPPVVDKPEERWEWIADLGMGIAIMVLGVAVMTLSPDTPLIGPSHDAIGLVLIIGGLVFGAVSTFVYFGDKAPRR